MIDLKRILWGSGVSVLVIGLGSFAVGRLSNPEALGMLSGMLPSTRFLCSAVITSTSTILALILTLISLSHRSDVEIEPKYFDQIKLIARLSCIAFIAAIILLLFVNLPLENSSEKLMVWYQAIYYFLLIYISLLGGLIIAIVLFLYKASKDIIDLVHPSASCDRSAVPCEEE